MKKNQDFYLFWIKSSKGTDDKAVYGFAHGTSEDDVKEFLEEWCSHFGAWQVSDNYVSYGFKRVKIPPRRKLLKQYDQACQRKYRATDKWAILAAMLNPRNTGVTNVR